jgi:hypothetical protein
MGRKILFGLQPKIIGTFAFSPAMGGSCLKIVEFPSFTPAYGGGERYYQLI